MRWSYYLYGEWDPKYQTHQGVDVQHPTSGKAVRNVMGTSARKVEVIRAESGGSFDGCVIVWDDYLKETIVYLHIGTPTVTKNQMIKAGDQIGTQSTQWKHTHFQAQDGKTTSIQPATYNTLKTRIPYGFMTWYI
ncbi:MAG: peptidoglycan DD-metalloendopeptidase family protein [Clostridia bacterium]|jgi:murein DD-endopeptidase MepM/ murein hydrolase activator NlpD|nr:peptidoglycan DD-metalloendopeptidase family protein [Clostridia bacterium]